MAKPTLLPPAEEAERREKPVHVRFTDEEYERFKRLAAYRKISLARLMRHVLVNAALPLLEEEMQAEIASAKPSLVEQG